MPFRQPDGTAPTIKDVMTRARLIESIGFDGIWFGEALGRHIRLPDPLMWLVAAAAATEHIEPTLPSARFFSTPD
jgi:alkanesulfonate monooxygenase SsuD/methylene tetrahydromethanopterin reductase-like flavin-dependent oxidoreductase (luciferase family)